MSQPIVADSTCLIGLERIDCLTLLPALFESIIIPPAVQQEFGTILPWLKIEVPTDRGQVDALQILVDAGEAEAIALAYQKRSRIILDDRQARAVARDLNLSIIGTVGVLVKAKQASLIPNLRFLLDALELNGFYLTEALKQEALNLAGE